VVFFTRYTRGPTCYATLHVSIRHCAMLFLFKLLELQSIIHAAYVGSHVLSEVWCSCKIGDRRERRARQWTPATSWIVISTRPVISSWR